MSTEGDIGKAALAVASTLTVSDIEAAVKFFVKLFGGHASARDLIDADEEAIKLDLDVNESVRISEETKP